MIPAAAPLAAPLRETVLGRLHPAVRLACAALGLATSLTAGPAALGVLAAVLALALRATGLGLDRQVASLRPWLPMILLLLLVHALTTVSAAPLGRFSLAGLAAGGVALLRVGCTVAWLGLLRRSSTLDDLLAGLGWWLGPLRRRGVRIDDLGLVLAVALGTIPLVQGEGRRIQTVVRLRGSGPGTAAGPGRWRRLLDRTRVALPLMETLIRRAEALTLSLRSRRPLLPAPTRPAAVQLLGLGAWTAALAGWWWLRRAGGAG